MNEEEKSGKKTKKWTYDNGGRNTFCKCILLIERKEPKWLAPLLQTT